MDQNRNSKLLFAAIAFFWYAQYVYIPYQTTYLTGTGTSAEMIGLILGIYGFSQLILRLPMGVSADRSDHHKLFIVIGGVVCSAASILRILMPYGTGFLVANLFSGLANSTWISFSVLYMSCFPDQPQRAASQLVLASNIGMLTGFIMSMFLYPHVGMRVICGFSACAGTLCAVVSGFIRKGTAKSSDLPVRKLLSVCVGKRLLFFSFLTLIQQGVQMSTTMSYTSQIIKDLGAGTMTVGLSSVLYMLSAVFCARFVSTPAFDRIRPQNWMAAVFCIIALYCILVPTVSSLTVICILQILPGMSTGILFSLLTSEAMKGIPEGKKSTAMGFFQAVYALGITVFPIISGKILAISSMAAAYFFLAAVCMGAAVLAYFQDKCMTKINFLS